MEAAEELIQPAEAHSRGSETIEDVVIGIADGLTVPFALAAGITGAINVSRLVVTAGAAEIAAGSIAMGLGGFLAARSALEYYRSERRREELEVDRNTDAEQEEVYGIFARYGLTRAESRGVVQALSRRRKSWVDFMMRFELGLKEPNPKRALISALTIGSSYAAGGILPLAPYLFIGSARHALVYSIAITVLALSVFGYVKARSTGAHALSGAVQTVLVGGLAAGAAFLLARLIA